ncbi:uncharacterized protein LOC126378805 [Pectinophora gossypiella]|uniref:uncharacterized protein LOC126378805 n=1 Tax=Pectinophora gossypiella TaxID=13191 RepID=UPI00214E8599|nr:uncharacterized protein LOC126378805 [Pectinophora gossypiella]
MDANVFVSKLKADGSKNDLTNLDEVFCDYKELLTKLTAKDRGPFSLNVLCVLCRNLEKAPSWRAQVNCKSLATLSIDCVRECRSLDTAEQVKTLACVYHIHKHVVRQNTPTPPELILKLSYMPFEPDNPLTDYCKTYWNILADRITYIEKLKAGKRAIGKLLQKLTEDVVKVIKMYDTVQFCSTILTFLVKKLHFLYNDTCSTELNQVFGKIFQEISLKPDLKLFKKLPDKETMDVYVKLNDCLYVIAENTSRINFKDSVLNTAIQTAISIVGHRPDMLHCLQTVFLNGFCSILTENPNTAYVETIITSLILTCETAEKLGYIKAMKTTYPYLNQFLRLYLEFVITNSEKRKWRTFFGENLQQSSLKLMSFLLMKLKSCEQILKCDNCPVKSGLHDALRLSFLIKSFISIPVKENMDLSQILPLYHAIILTQYDILQDLCSLGCSNYEKCYRKLQSDVHNTSILLNKSQNFEYSVKLFEMYLKNEIIHFKNENDMRNISRAMYNKSICELDSKQFESALLDAYLSLIFAYPEGLETEKYMSLVMDIKAKALKTKEKDDQTDDNGQFDDLQLITSLDVCAIAIEGKKYGNLKPFFCNLKFSEILKHEFEMYVRLWPSIVPIAGVWKTLYDLSQHDVPWLNAKDENIRGTLYEIVVRTPSVVRTIHSDHYSEIVNELLEKIQDEHDTSAELKVVHATLLFLKAEFDLAEASQKHGWKVTEPSLDPDNLQPIRTLPQEFEATKRAIQAVEMWMDIANDIHTVAVSLLLEHSLKVAQVFVQVLLHLHRMLFGLQLAYVCCAVAQHIGDRETYVRNASAIIYNANRHTEEVAMLISCGSNYCQKLMENDTTLETALVFLGDCAIYYNKIGSTGLAAKLTRALQAKILQYTERYPDKSLNLATGRLLEAQAGLYTRNGPSTLSAVFGVHRHYLTLTNNETKWTTRRLRSSTSRISTSIGGVCSSRLSRRLLLPRRARAAAGAAWPAAAAQAHGCMRAAVTDVHNLQDAQINIDNRLKFILGLPSSTDQPLALETTTKSHLLSTPKQELETMLENLTFKKTQTSPSLPCLSIPGFKIPDFLKHEKHCLCYACDNPFSFILASQTSGLEASMYFRAKEFEIAKNYFEGAFMTLSLAESKLKSFKNGKKFEKFLVDFVDKALIDQFREVELDVLIEAAFFELSQSNYKNSDEYIVRIHENLQENPNVSPYMRTEVLNLLAASAKLRNTVDKRPIDELEAELENLKLSPTRTAEPPKTPETKAEKPPKLSKIKVKDEEVPNTKRRVIKLNLDDTNSDEKETVKTKRVSKRNEFKIPVPVTSKPVLESITPIPRRRKPDLLVTQPSLDLPGSSILDFATPKPKTGNHTEFFTPMDTPEQFFTPMSTLKTYTKRTLRQGIVKNLETEFATPKSEAKKQSENTFDQLKTQKVPTKETEKENSEKSNSEIAKVKAKVESGSVKSLKDKRTLKRATSPGKLDKVDRKPTRSSRLRQPAKFNLDDNEKK